MTEFMIGQDCCERPAANRTQEFAKMKIVTGTLSVMVLVVVITTTGAVEETKLPFDTYSSYFVSN